MLRIGKRTVKRPPLGREPVSGYYRNLPNDQDSTPAEASVALSMRGLLGILEQLRTRHRRRLAFLAPALERRRPRIAAEDYAARHSIEHTLDRKAELRRMAPTWPPAARRYYELLTYELDGLKELANALQSVTEGRELEEALAETNAQMERLEIEIAWCAGLLKRAGPRAVVG
jgi:hypothetical protein